MNEEQTQDKGTSQKVVIFLCALFLIVGMVGGAYAMFTTNYAKPYKQGQQNILDNYACQAKTPQNNGTQSYQSIRS